MKLTPIPAIQPVRSYAATELRRLKSPTRISNVSFVQLGQGPLHKLAWIFDLLRRPA